MNTHVPIRVEMTLAQIAELRYPDLTVERDRLREGLQRAVSALISVQEGGLDIGHDLAREIAEAGKALHGA